MSQPDPDNTPPWLARLGVTRTVEAPSWADEAWCVSESSHAMKLRTALGRVLPRDGGNWVAVHLAAALHEAHARGDADPLGVLRGALAMVIREWCPEAADALETSSRFPS